MCSPELRGYAPLLRRTGLGVVYEELAIGRGGAEAAREFVFNVETEFAFGFKHEDIAPGGKAGFAVAEVLLHPVRTANQQGLAAGRRVALRTPGTSFMQVAVREETGERGPGIVKLGSQ